MKEKLGKTKILDQMPTLILMDSSISLLRPHKRSSDNGLDNSYDNLNESF